MNEFEIWRRVTHSNPDDDHDKNTRRLYIPAIEPVGNLPYELAGLLPNREHNRDLMDLIGQLPENRSETQCVIGVFAADPFLNCKRLADHLIAKGYDQVANIPPVAAYGFDFLSTLDKVASGRAIEQENLDHLAELGISVSPALATISCLAAVQGRSSHRLWIVPSFDMWENNFIPTDKLLGLCRDVTRKTNVPAVLAVGQSDVSEADALWAGARGILIDDW